MDAELSRILELAGVLRESRAFAPDAVSGLPQGVIDKAEELYRLVEGKPDQIGDTATVDGYAIETHTLGCRNAADDPEDEWWDRHWAIYDEYSQDGKSLIGGDPASGVFVTITPPPRSGINIVENAATPGVPDKLLAALVKWDLLAQKAGTKARTKLEQQIIALTASMPKPALNGILYRGQGMAMADYRDFLSGNPVTLEPHGLLSSWSTDRNLAKSFAEDIHYEKPEFVAVTISVPASDLDPILDVPAIIRAATQEQHDRFDLHVLAQEDEILVRSRPVVVTAANCEVFEE